LSSTDGLSKQMKDDAELYVLGVGRNQKVEKSYCALHISV